ncbi:MAG: formiminoglutamase [Bdellovibrionales bacterium RBG_16_40_8]|nr:MAG: formiminoglutamase [Bdellovibrionales bacterium RBG_16_40_8]
MKPFFISIPHAGEVVPQEAYWLKKLAEPVLMCDVDRYVDELYGPAAEAARVPTIIADVHRYVVDLNRLPEDIDQNSVVGSQNPSGKFTTGYHWSQTTTGEILIKTPISIELHKELTKKYFQPFHNRVAEAFTNFRNSGHKHVFHLDAHSMPSMGTAIHRDPGTKRPQIVVSDRDGKSCDQAYKDLVIKAYESAGFEVTYNWPYKGGRITETYGQAAKGQHTLQVEMNRSLYMDEITKKKNTDKFFEVVNKIEQAIAMIVEELTT